MLKSESFEKDKQTVRPGGEMVRGLIDGVSIKEMPNIVTRNGLTSEVFRNEWGLTPRPIVHMIYATLRANAISAWHYHKLQTDHIFVTQGTIKLVLFDNREDSPTAEMVNVFHLSRFRPTTIVIPPYIVHGLQNLDASDSGFINFFDREYQYDDPDDYRLPLDSPLIPFTF